MDTFKYLVQVDGAYYCWDDNAKEIAEVAFTYKTPSTLSDAVIAALIEAAHAA